MDLSEVQKVINQISTRPPSPPPQQPSSRSAASFAIALYNFLNYLKQHPPLPHGQPHEAAEANRLLTLLRSETILHQLPSLDSFAQWIPLDKDDTFLNYHNDLIKQYQTKPSTIDPQTLYIPPLFSQFEISASKTGEPTYYNPLAQKATDINEQQSQHQSTNITSSTPSTPASPQSLFPSSIVPNPSPNQSSATPFFSPIPSSPIPTAAPINDSPTYASAITTHPLPTLRALIWKSFVLGPLMINFIHIGFIHLQSMNLAIPPPYNPTLINNSTTSNNNSNNLVNDGNVTPLGSNSSFGSNSGSREGRLRDTSTVRSLHQQSQRSISSSSTNSSNAPTLHHDFVNHNFIEEGDDEALSFSSSVDNSTNSIISTGTNSNSTQRQLNESLHTTSSQTSSTATFNSISTQTPPQNALASNTNVITLTNLNTNFPTTLLTSRGQKTMPSPSIFTSGADYISILTHGQGLRYSMIRDDSFRTFRTDLLFKRVVPEQALIRVCDAFDLQYGSNWKYCQGMNVYAGMFLYIMPELDAYSCFVMYCTQFIPYYWRSNHIGVEAGCAVLDQVLHAVDPDLYKTLINLTPKLFAILYAFSFVKTMSASASPLSEVIKLWDLQLALGPMFNICCVAAQILVLKPKIMESTFPKSILDYRNWPQLDAQRIVTDGFDVLKRIINGQRDKELIVKLQLHPSNARYVTELAGRSPHTKD